METATSNHQIKRTKALRILTGLLVFVYVMILSLSLIFNGNFHRVWFSIAVIFIGIQSITRAVFFHLDSAMFFGLCCFVFGLLSSVLFFYAIDFRLILYFLSFAFINLLMYFIFRQNFYIISFALIFGEVLLLISNNFIGNLTIFWLIQSFYIIVTCVVILSVTSVRKEK